MLYMPVCAVWRCVLADVLYCAVLIDSKVITRQAVRAGVRGVDGTESWRLSQCKPT